jgi:hypothetical protein
MGSPRDKFANRHPLAEMRKMSQSLIRLKMYALVIHLELRYVFFKIRLGHDSVTGM